MSSSFQFMFSTLLLLILTLNAFVFSSPFENEVFTRVEQLAENYTVNWTVNRTSETIVFTVTALTAGYIGFGISDSGSMSYADLIIGGVYSNKSTYFSDRYSLQPGVPIVDEIQNWYLIDGIQSGSLTELTFSRKFDTGDTTGDFVISDKWTNFIWSIGSTDDIAYHAARGIFSVNILDDGLDFPSTSTETATDGTSTVSPSPGIFNRSETFHGNYSAFWIVDKEAQKLTVTLNVLTTGYVGFGISDSGTMTNADLIIGGVHANKTVYFADRYATGHGEPAVDLEQNWNLISASEAFGVTTLIFERNFKTGDTVDDIDITDRDTYFLWSIGSTDSVEHHAVRGAFSLNILDENYEATPGPGDDFTRTESFSPDYSATWTVNQTSQSVLFSLSVRTLGYVGFGISDSGFMTNADLIIGGVRDDKTVYFADRYATGHGLPAVDESQDWILLGASEAFNVTTLVFQRPFFTKDSQNDIDIVNKNTYFIWSIGSSDDLEHHAQRGNFPVNILQDPNSS